MSSIAAAPLDHGDLRMPHVREADPTGTIYVYRGEFTANVTHSVFVDWQGGDSEQVDMTATIRGSIPELRQDDQGFMTPTRTPGTVVVDSATGTGITRADSGRYVQTCKATTGSASPAPLVIAKPNLGAGENVLIPFPLLTVPASCTDTDGRSSTNSFQYGPVEAFIQRMKPGTPGADLHFVGGWDTSQADDDELASICPRFIPGQTPRCKYIVEGTPHLALVEKVLPPTKRTPKPKGATISRGARKVGAGVLCEKKCTVTMSVVTLKGGRQVVAPRILRPTPGRVVEVKVSIPASKRALVRKAGGVRMKLTFRLAGGRRYSETRTARL